MPPSDTTGEGFRGLLLQLRGRTGLTQRDLATRIGVHVGSIQGWEAGANFPGVASLQALIAAILTAGGFMAGHERAEAQALWAEALRDAPRLRTPFDTVWFERLIDEQRATVQAETVHTVASPSAAPRPPARTTPAGARRTYWGEAPDIAGFLGRAAEREQLRRWVLDEGSRVVALLGLGGIGKSLLATRLAHDVASSFERIVWRSLRDAPMPAEWLAETIRLLAPDDPSPAQAEPAQLRRLLDLLRDTRCLLVLDNFESVLQPGSSAGEYRPGYERFGALLRQVAEAPHPSCLVVTSREEPPELGPLHGEHGPARVMALAGLPVEVGRALLSDKRLDGDDDAWRALVGHCGGNGLALKVVGETTREVFGGSIADFLEYMTESAGVMVGGMRQLLHEQMQRLSKLEQELLRRLAVEREPIGLAGLAAQLSPHVGRAATLAALQGLRRRSLVERIEREALFVLHSVVLEHVTELLIEDVAHELAIGAPDRLLRQPLLKATAKEYVRRSQERLIAAPIVEQLVQSQGRAWGAEQRLIGLLDRQRGRPLGEQEYGPGNIVNLLRLLRGNLKGVDLSDLSIRQAYLQDVEAHGASLAGAHLSETVLGEAFGYLTALALSADGAYLVVGTAGGEVNWWRLADRTLLATVQGHAGAVWRAALSGDGRLVASAGLDGTVRLWDAKDGRLVATLLGHDGGVRGVALSDDGRLVASGGVDGTVRLWETEGGQLLATLHGHDGAVWDIALSEDGRLVASAGLDGTVRLWDAERGRPLAALHGHDGGVRGVALSGDGRLIASGGVDGTVRVWEAAGERLVATLTGHDGGVRSVALCGDGRLVASGGLDGTVRLWEAEGGQPLATLHGHDGAVWDVALCGDGRLVASGGLDGPVRLWDTEGGRALAMLTGHAGGVRGVALSGDGRLVASGGVDGSVRLWTAESGALLAILQGHSRGVRGVALSGDGRLVASGAEDGTVRLWEAARGQPLATLHGHSGGVWRVALSGDGHLVASGGWDGSVRLWETESGRLRITLHEEIGGVWGVALSEDGRLLASGAEDGTVRLWETDGGRPLATLQAHPGGVRAVALSGDGRLAASCGMDATVRLWQTDGGRPLATLHGHSGGVLAVTLSGDGRLVASGGFDGTVRLWEAAGGRALATLRGHTGAVWGVALSGDGHLVASVGEDGTVRLWDTSTGALRSVSRVERRCEALDITGLTGITDAQRRTLLTLGAVERNSPTSSPA